VDTRVATYHLGAQDSAVQSHRTNTVLPCLQLRSYLTGRHHVEIPKVEMYNEVEADEARQLELNSVEEARCTVLVQSARYLQGIRRYHDRNVRERSFNIGDLVYAASKTSPAYISSTQGRKVRSSSNRLPDRGRIDYNTPRAKISRTLRTFRTCASSTHEEACGDSRSPDA
jgi:hypothetical protein